MRVFCALALFPALLLFGRVFPDKGMMKSCFVFWRFWLCLPEIQNVQLLLLAGLILSLRISSHLPVS